MWTPWELLSQTPSGGKYILKISKRPVTVSVLETPNTLSYTNKMEKGVKWTPWDLLSQTPSRGLRFL